MAEGHLFWGDLRLKQTQGIPAESLGRMATLPASAEAVVFTVDRDSAQTAGGCGRPRCQPESGVESYRPSGIFCRPKILPPDNHEPGFSTD